MFRIRCNALEADEQPNIAILANISRGSLPKSLTSCLEKLLWISANYYDLYYKYIIIPQIKLYKIHLLYCLFAILQKDCSR